MKSYNNIDKIRIISILILSILIFIWIIFIVNPNNISSKVPILAYRHKNIADFIDDAEYKLKDIRRYMEYRRENIQGGVYTSNKEYIDNLKIYQKDIENIIVYISQKNPPKELRDYKRLTIQYLNTSKSIISSTLSASIVLNKEDKDAFIRESNLYINEYNTITKKMNEELISILEDKGIDYKIHNNRISYWWRN
ncbi:hypothetical protein GOQ27_11880 [Clostridium sp. D2Q-11]|uniref:Uncharacterized protein n=1 Tax=Anaeromonas frigoriresistens TaxID=2683708 RepID=A0A942Z9T4_9FIRM|nr:hypothetical protein [Anaeromonas frigoriresistens]MBS4539165.1 hypothetical protein [Anaeromonas frigoriresistens]